MTWIRIDALAWHRGGRPVIAVAVDNRRVIRACAPLVARFRDRSWYDLKRWLTSVAGPFTYEVLRGR